MNRIEELDLDSVADVIVDLYERSDKSISWHTVRKVLDQWSIQKYEIYKRFGNRLYFQSEASYKVKADLEDIRSFFHGVQKRIYEKGLRSIEETYFFSVAKRIYYSLTSVNYLNYAMNISLTNKHELLWLVTQLFGNSARIALNLLMRKYDFFKSPKLTKQIGLIAKTLIKTGLLDKKEANLWLHAFNSIISEAVTAFNKQTTENMFYSIHPLDFVTLSYNSYSWRSCFSPDGEYAKSVFSVMADPSTFVAGFGKLTSDLLPQKATCFDKKTRAMVSFDDEYENLLINKIYPGNSNIMRELYREAINEQQFVPCTSELSKVEIDADVVGLYNDIEDNEITILGPTDDPNLVLSFSIGNPTNRCMACGEDMPDLSCGDNSMDWSCGCEEEEEEYCE